LGAVSGAAWVSDLTDAELAKMEMLLRDRSTFLDIDDSMRIARELLEEVHRQRQLLEQAGFLGAENERLHVHLAKAQESNRNLLDWHREAERLRVELEKLRHHGASLRP